MSYKYKPLGTTFIARVEQATVSSGGILIPETVAQQNLLRGTVVAVGPGYEDDPCEVSVGDVVLFDADPKRTNRLPNGDYVVQNWQLLVIEVQS